MLKVSNEPRVGDRVWHLTQRQATERKPKVTHHWTGIFRILEVLQDGQIKIDKILQPGNPVVTTIQYIQPYLPTKTRMFSQPRSEITPPAPPNTTGHLLFQMPKLPRASPYSLQPVKEVPATQPLLSTKPPRPWFPTRVKADEGPVDTTALLIH